MSRSQRSEPASCLVYWSESIGLVEMICRTIIDIAYKHHRVSASVLHVLDRLFEHPSTQALPLICSFDGKQVQVADACLFVNSKDGAADGGAAPAGKNTLRRLQSVRKAYFPESSWIQPVKSSVEANDLSIPGLGQERIKNDGFSYFKLGRQRFSDLNPRQILSHEAIPTGEVRRE